MPHQRFVIGLLLIAGVSVCWHDRLALAQSGDDQTRLVRMLTGRSETVRVRTLMRLRSDRQLLTESLEALILALHTQVDQLGELEVPPSMVEMVDLVAMVDQPSATEALVQLLDSDQADISMLSAEALGRRRHSDAIEALGRQVERSEYNDRYAFRFNLIRALAMMKHPDAIELLAKLEPTLSGQLRYEIREILRQVTVDDFGGDSERFAALVNKSDKESVIRTASFEQDAEESNYEPPIQFARSQYYGIEIHAQRVMFVIDHSGSMKARTSSGSRLMRAKHELITAITDLPDDAEFAILAFDSRVRPWREELSLANEENKRSAILFVRRLDYGSDTNTYGALRRAIDFDDEMEAVFLLTDGKPTDGKIIKAAQIVADILHRNRWRHLNLNMIGISVSGPTETFLRSLAENSGGEFRAAY